MMNRKLKLIFSLVIVLAVIVLTAYTCHAVNISANPSPAIVNQPVTFSINTGAVSCTVLIDYGEGSGYQQVALWSSNPSPTMTLKHTYTVPGTYKVWVMSSVCNAFPPNPNSVTLKVVPPTGNTSTTSTTSNTSTQGSQSTQSTQSTQSSQSTQSTTGTIVKKPDLSINGIELKFINNRPEITIKKNDSSPGLHAEIFFKGSGLLKGYWEVDGLKRRQLSKHLTIGPSALIPYPKSPSLPTYTPGTHRVRFVVTRPALTIDFPLAIYFVETREAIVKMPIKLIFPQKNEILPFKPIQFRWQQIKKINLYKVSFFVKETKEPVYSAYSESGVYEVGSRVLNSRFLPDLVYLWQVQGLDEQGEVAAQSGQFEFSISQEAAWVPGHILIMTKKTPKGDQAILDVKQKFDLQILDQYDIETLKSKVTLFFTRQNIFKIIDTAKMTDSILIAQPDFIFKTISEPLSDIQNINDLLKIDTFQTRLSGRGIKIGILDTGIDLEHQDLKKAVIFSQNFIRGHETKGEIHGTAVAGLIAARRNNFGIEGVAPDTALLALRACRQVSKDAPLGECYSSTMLSALDAGIQQGAKIINMSLGAPAKDRLLSRLISKGSERGILFVAPAGSKKEMKKLNFPASHPKVIAVAGSGGTGSFFPNDDIAQAADILAPFENLFTTFPGNAHNFISGTSMSSALVSGLLALFCENNPDFVLTNPDGLKNNIQAWIRHVPADKEIAGKSQDNEEIIK